MSPRAADQVTREDLELAELLGLDLPADRSEAALAVAWSRVEQSTGDRWLVRVGAGEAVQVTVPNPLDLWEGDGDGGLHDRQALWLAAKFADAWAAEVDAWRRPPRPWSRDRGLFLDQILPNLATLGAGVLARFGRELEEILLGPTSAEGPARPWELPHPSAHPFPIALAATAEQLAAAALRTLRALKTK